MSATRNNYLDYLREIAILLVVVGHCIQFDSVYVYQKSGLYYVNPVFKFTYSRHIQLLILISSYSGWYFKSKKSYKESVILRDNLHTYVLTGI